MICANVNKPIDSACLQCPVCKAWAPLYIVHYCTGAA